MALRSPTDAFDLANDVGSAQEQTLEEMLAEDNLLTMDAVKAGKRVIEDFEKSEPRVKSLKEQWRINRLRSRGYTGLRLIKIQDEQRAIIPLGATPNMAAMNQAGRLKRRMRSQMFSDPPIPECDPASDEDEDRDAAEFSTRVLISESGEGRLSYEIVAADAFDLASDYGSGFIRFMVDPQGGGWQPLQIWASPRAPNEQIALIDPSTGNPWKASAPGEPDFILRYVRKDGTLTDDRNDPKLKVQWLPGLRAELLTGKHVRFLPDTARDLWEAEGIQIGAMTPLGTLKAMFPRLRKMQADEIAKLAQARPSNVKDLLPRGYRDLSATGLDDNTPIFNVTRYHRQCAAYPKGCYIVVAGEDTVLFRSDWWDEQHHEPLDIPLTQFKQFNDEESAYGIALMEFLGPGNELRAFLFGVILEHFDRFVRRKTFLPTTSNLQPEQMQSETATVLSIVPGGEPKYEDIPELPAFVEKMFTQLKEDLNDEAGLQEAAQGLNPPGVKSGVHADKIVQQVVVGLSDLRQNTERALVRGWRIMLQQVRAFYTVPQQISWVGDDLAFRQRAFVGTDLGNTKDVKLARGSFTGLSRDAKANLAIQYAQLQIFDPLELKHVIAGNVGGTIGLEDDAHRARVRRQIGKWNDGPPEGWQPPQPTVDPRTLQVVPPPPDPILGAIFDARDVDEDPRVAPVRAYELGRAMASTKYSKWASAPAWQDGLRMEYLKARRAAGIFTVAEQQQAQQAQADAQAQAQADEQAAQQQEGAANRKVKTDSDAQKAELQREQMQHKIAEQSLGRPVGAGA